MVWVTFGFTHPKSASQLDRQHKHCSGLPTQSAEGDCFGAVADVGKRSWNALHGAVPGSTRIHSGRLVELCGTEFVSPCACPRSGPITWCFSESVERSLSLNLGSAFTPISESRLRPDREIKEEKRREKHRRVSIDLYSAQTTHFVRKADRLRAEPVFRRCLTVWAESVSSPSLRPTWCG